jgi:AraC-like DNA-binding protein
MSNTIPTEGDRSKLRSSFIKKMGLLHQFHLLFDNIPGIYFFVKDTESRMIFGSQALLVRLGLESQDALVGTTDYDHFPKHVADRFVLDDQQVISTGKPLINHLELWYNQQRLLDMFVTQKHPVYGANGKIIGVMGTVQSYENNKKSVVPYLEVIEAVDYIRENYDQKIKVPDLAALSNISPRQLNRRFISVFGINAQQFLIKTRIQSACEALLNSQKSILEISMDVGFCDQSAFTQHFHKHVGVTPHKYRIQSGAVFRPPAQFPRTT